MTRQEEIQELKKEFTYVPVFDIEHVQLDEKISRDIKTGFVYHELTPYGKLEFANMHTVLHLTTTVRPLCCRMVVGINDDQLPRFNPEMPAADFLAYSTSESFMGSFIITYWYVVALFHETPLIANEIFNRNKWVAYKMEELTDSDRKEMMLL